jgi:hypothetical protein
MPNENLMPNEVPNLWPADLLDVQLTTPLTILKKQANDLATATSALLRGEVITETSGDLFEHRLFIVAPALDYRYRLCKVSHKIALYPCNGHFLRRPPQQIDSEELLLAWLHDVFRDPDTHKILASLIAQSKA